MATLNKFLGLPDKLQDNNLKEQEKTALQRKKSFNGLSAKEWTQYSKSVWDIPTSPRTKNQLEHGATYPEALCDRVIMMYSHEGDTVLDPFLGTGTTLVSAIKNGRNGVGIELTDRFYPIAEQNISDATKIKKGKYTLLKGDCTEMLKQIESESIQLVMTSPPYANLIHIVVDDREKRHKKSMFVTHNNSTTNVYSDNDKDLGNMPMEQYIESVKKIMAELYRVTKKGGYCIWVVKDFRDTANNIPYIDLHSKIANAGESVGFRYHDLIIWNQNEQRKLVCLGYPSVYYMNQNHSYLVVMRKP